MQPRTKSIIIIIGALIVFGIIVATVFGLFSGTNEPQAPAESVVVLPDRNEGLPEGAVFDSTNADGFAAVVPSAGSAGEVPALERDALDIATFFIERFGTYSSDSGFSYIDDLSGFMTDSMRRAMDAYKLSAPKRDGFYAVTADIASITTDVFLPKTRSARFSVVLNRSETAGASVEQYQQEAIVSLTQSGGGVWFVDSVVWGARL